MNEKQKIQNEELKNVAGGMADYSAAPNMDEIVEFSESEENIIPVACDGVAEAVKKLAVKKL